MKMNPIIAVVVASMFFTGCATVEKKEIYQTSVQPAAVSKTIATKNTKSLKRKVAIGRFTNETTYGQGFLLIVIIIVLANKPWIFFPRSFLKPANSSCLNVLI